MEWLLSTFQSSSAILLRHILLTQLVPHILRGGIHQQRQVKRTRRSILGSDCMTLISMLWVLYECSLIALWPRKMKIDCSRQTWTGRTDGRTDEHRSAFIELLSEPKRKKSSKKIQCDNERAAKFQEKKRQEQAAASAVSGNLHPSNSSKVKEKQGKSRLRHQQ